MLKKALFLLLHVSMVPFLIREIWQRRRVTILLYHRVEPDFLDRHLAVLGRHYNFISLSEFLRIRSGQGSGRFPRKAVILTLDDGHASNRELLPVLKKHGIRCTIFVCTGIAGSRRHFWFLDPAAEGEIRELTRAKDEERLARLEEKGFREDREYPTRHSLSWEEMDAMREWVDFQPHTRFHPALPGCSEERAEREIRGSKADLAERGYPVYAFAYPNGDYSERDVSLVRAAGYDCALTVDLGFNSMSTDRYRLKRIGIYDESGGIEALVRASGLWSALRTLARGRP
jgi:peptidoglycan/xylan/chitin deacetylase (PgdA/CDA1 family)